MQQFIQMATATLGTSEQVARTVTGGLLDLITKSSSQADVSTLLNRLPGASDLLTAFRASPPPTPAAAAEPSLLGSLTNAASSVLGGGASMLGAGSSALGTGAAGLGGLAAVFNQNGLDVTKVPQLVALFAQWAGSQAGPDVVQRVLEAIPGVSTILASLGSFNLPGMKR